MSLESLTALKQLVQVQQQGEQNQQQNLEKVQDAVQQVGSTEAQRMDQIALEKAKAEYDAALQAAVVERLESKKAREEKALATAGLAAVGAAVLSIGDNVINFMNDAGVNPFTKRDDNGGVQTLGDQGRESVQSINPGHANVSEVKRDNTSASDFYLSGKNSNGSETVQRVSRNSDNSISDDVRVATVNSDDVKAALTQGNFALVGADGKATDRAKVLGLVDDDGNFTRKAEGLGLGNAGDKFNVDNIKSFSDLQNLEDGLGLNAGNRASEALFDKKSKSIKKDEVGGLLDVVEGTSKRTGLSTGNVRQALESSGKISDGPNVGKAAINALISIADTTVPFLQAWLKMKDRVIDTEIELQAAKEKLAAALNKIRELSKLLSNAGYEDKSVGTTDAQSAENL